MTDVKPPGWTCPDLDRLARLIRRHIVDEPDRGRALELVERIRADNVQLRKAAGRP